MKKLLLSLLVVHLTCITNSQDFCSDGDKDILEQIWIDLNQPALANWDFSPGSVLDDSWEGIQMTTSGECNIRSITLNSLGLTGTLAPELGDLTELQALYLYNNSISGPIPAELGNLDNLVVLNLGLNQLTGSIPPELGDLDVIFDIYLLGNQLSGSIPASIGSLNSLEVLSLGNNQLSGNIPSSFSNLINLTSLSLGTNSMDGNIPAFLGSLTDLNYLGLSENGFSGSIPPELGNLNNLNQLFLHTNQLSGSVPEELGNLTGLSTFFFHTNQLSGCIPNSFHQLCAAGVGVQYQNNPLLLNDNYMQFCNLNLGDCELDPSFDFVTTWQTDNLSGGSSGTTSIKIPVFPSETYDFTIDWDGAGPLAPVSIVGLGSAITNDLEFDYGTEGAYTVRISGEFPRIYFNNSGDRDKLISVDQWGSIAWSSMESAFEGCSNLAGQASDTPDLTEVSDMSNMFRKASAFNQQIGDWDVGSVTDMSSLFRESESFNQPLIAWDVAQVAEMDHMFEDAISFDQSLDSWVTMNVTTMNSMFEGAIAFNGDINGNQNPNSWNVSNVTDMQDMFYGASTFNRLIGGWNVSSVTEMGRMFNDASSFNAALGTWDTSNVTDMSRMFFNAIVFNQDLSNWGVQNVTTMSFMFRNATSFDQNIGSWQIPSLITAGSMFLDAELSVTNYDALLCGWGSQTNVNSNVSLHGGNSFYCLCDNARTELINLHGWNIQDGGLQCELSPDDFVITINTALGGLPSNSTFTVPTFFGETYSYFVDWDNNGSFLEPAEIGDAFHDFGTPGIYTIRIKGTFPRVYFTGSDQEVRILSVDQWGNNPWTSMQGAFSFCSNLHVLASDAPNLSGVVDLQFMFGGATSMNEDISSWDLSNVIFMDGMFQNATAFDQNINAWNVENVAVMSSMFKGAVSFNQDISGWNMSNVSNLNSMFEDAIAFNQPIGEWNLNSPTNFNNMFRGAVAFDQNIGSWHIGSLGFASNMFLDAGLSVENYDALLCGWSSQAGLNSGISFHAGSSEYCLCSDARDILTNDNGWTITDSGEDPLCEPPACYQSDKDVLEQVWIALNSPSLTNWDFTSGVELNGTWEGISMTADGCNIKQIDLRNIGLTGIISSELGDLEFLDLLWLDSNDLTGTVPSSLGNLALLNNLSLYANDLTGIIPISLGNLSNLAVLRLDFNELTGPIPSELGGIGSLAFLYLNGNQLSGNIPLELGGLSNLNDMFLQNNDLSGCIPSDLQALCISGTTVDLSNNPLLDNDNWSTFCSDGTGDCNGTFCFEGDKAILEQVWQALNNPSLTNWDFSPSADLDNSWQGITMTTDGCNVKEINLDNLGLSGSISDALTSLSELDFLLLRDNNLTGGIPTTIGDLSNLTYINLTGNGNLGGVIPASIGNLSNLETLALGDCGIGGGIPDALTMLPNATIIWLDTNPLGGAIPEFGSANTALESLHLNSCQLTGSLPSSLGEIPNVSSLWLQNNDFGDCIPATYGVLCGSDVRLQMNPQLVNDDFATFCSDGIGQCNCFGDLDGDGLVSTSDLLIVIASFGSTCTCPADLDNDGIVAPSDIILLLSLFGTVCP